MSSKNKEVQKAQKTASKTKKVVKRQKYKIRTNLRFYKPKTLKVASVPKYAHTKKSLKMSTKLDKYSVFIHPLSTEKDNKNMTERNTLAFIVHPRSNKIQIKDSFKELYNVKPRSVNTLFRPDGKKKAYIRLNVSDDAANIATKIGII